jgi:hypothetical protein
MIVSMWEWTVGEDEHGGPVGVSMTRHGAMKALAKTLVGAGRPSRGQVIPMILARPAHAPSYYLRFWPQHTAVYDGQVLRWR